MAADYFINHYAVINKIDPNSESSIKQWFNNCTIEYEREIGKYIGELKDKSILELGCGIGGLLKFLQIKGAVNIIGVDSAPDQIEFCKKYVSNKVIQSDVIEYLKGQQNQFDYIFAFDLIEHIKKEQMQEFCSLIYRNLKDGGKIIIRTPNMGCLFAFHSRYIDYTHEIGFTEESINQVLKEAGFKKITVDNSYIGKKRLLSVRIFQRMLEKLYNIRLSRIVTKNIIVLAEK